MKTESYKDLTIWQKSMELVVEIYNLTRQFPKTESYGLSSQMQRAAVSIPSNIAEGYRRSHLPEYIQFLSIGYGSGAELETQIEICKRIPQLKSLQYKRADELLNEIMRMFNVLIAKLSAKRYALQPIR
mgnify:FL=1